MATKTPGETFFDRASMLERLVDKHPDWCPIETLAHLSIEAAEESTRVQASAQAAKFLYPTQSKTDKTVTNELGTNLVDYLREARQRIDNPELVANLPATVRPHSDLTATPVEATFTPWDDSI